MTTDMKKIFSVLALFCISILVVSCSSEVDEMQQVGYLKLELTTLVSTNTRATPVPAGYDAKKLAVKVIDATGDIVAETQDVTNDDKFKSALTLAPGDYTITASSAGWDGSDSGFGTPYYAGSATATVKSKTLTTSEVKLTQANVKVTVNYAENIRSYFTSATCVVTSAITGVAAQTFGLTTIGSAFFPVGDLKFFLGLTNKAGESNSMEKTITDVKARDHYIINYKLADAGSMGGVTVKIDDATQSYSFDIEIPRKAGTAMEVKKANAWSNFAELSGEVTSKTSSFDVNKIKMQWKKEGDTDWTDIPSTNLTAEGDKFACKLTGLNPSTQYVYRMAYAADGEDLLASNEVKFTTETQTQIENNSFETWTKDGSTWYPSASSQNTYWNSSNPGSTSMGDNYNVTTKNTDFTHSGSASACLSTKYVVIKLAAASLFTGQFQGLIGTNGAKLDWGVPFTSRPSALKGYFNFKTGAINRGNQPSGAPAKGNNDACQIFCALLTEQLKVGGNAEEGEYKKSTVIDWEQDPRIIAYGQMTKNASSPANTWEELNIPLTYYSLTKKPQYMLIVISANKWGDYFYGCDSNVLYVDDFSFEYGEPTVK